MVYLKTARQLALSFEGAAEMPHFEATSFRVKNKIFMTLDEKNNRACIKLPEIEQDVFSTIDKNIIYPVPNKWGRQGWTFVKLKFIKKGLFQEVVTTAFCQVAPKMLADKYRK